MGSFVEILHCSFLDEHYPVKKRPTDDPELAVPELWTLMSQTEVEDLWRGEKR
jgi:hypothetical protein